jgi:hypothetical protein
MLDKAGVDTLRGALTDVSDLIDDLTVSEGYNADLLHWLEEAEDSLKSALELVD